MKWMLPSYVVSFIITFPQIIGAVETRRQSNKRKLDEEKDRVLGVKRKLVQENSWKVRKIAPGDVPTNLKTTVLSASGSKTVNMIDAYAKDDETLAQEGFFIAVDMDRMGERKIFRIHASTQRPPTRYGESQGHHIVAYSLLTTAMKNSMKDSLTYHKLGRDKTFLGAPNKDKTVLETLKELLDFDGNDIKTKKKVDSKFVDVNKGTIDKDLEQLKVFISYEAHYDKVKEESFRTATRKVYAARRRAIARVAENIIRLWNKRIYAVYYTVPLLKKDKRREYEQIFRNGGGNEGPALQKLEKLDREKSTSKRDICKEIAKLIDLCVYDDPTKADEIIENKLKELGIYKGGGENEEGDGEDECECCEEEVQGEVQGEALAAYETELVKYTDIKNKAVIEAARLAKLAFKNLERHIDTNEIEKQMKNLQDNRDQNVKDKFPCNVI